MTSVDLNILTHDEVIADQLRIAAPIMVPNAGLIKAGFIMLPGAPRPLPRRASEGEMRRAAPDGGAAKE
jgi:hypothetical protein